MAEDNPSVVNDASGSNYNIGSGGSMAQAQMEYIENLQKLAAKMPPKPLSTDQYMPGEAQGIQQGQVSGSIIGSQPLFAASNLIPFGMMDEMKRSSVEAEANYYAKLKPYLDKPLIDAKLKLSNPVAQPAFASKVQVVTDKMLDIATERQGGNHMMGYIALQHDPEYLKFLDSVGQYADMYNSVYGEALDTVKKMANPQDYYVSPDQKAAVNKFLTTQDIFAKDSKNTSFDGLVNETREFQAKASVFKLADAATEHLKEDVVDSAFYKSSLMSTDEENVFVKTKTTGTKGQAEEIYNAIIKATPDLDDSYKELLKKEIEGRVKYGVETSIAQVKQHDADQKLALKKMGVDVQDDGSIKFTSTKTALFDGVGYNAVNLSAMKPIQSVTGMTGYVSVKGIIRHVAFDEAYPTTLKSEYDIGLGANSQVRPDRYTEVNMSLQSTEPYQVQKYYQMKGIPIPVGDPRGSTQPVPAVVRDVDTGVTYDIMGNQTILVEHEQLDKAVEANFPGMDYVHRELQKDPYPHSTTGNLPTGHKDNPIKYTPGTTLDKIKNDPNVWYVNVGGKKTSGADLYNIVNK
jgi:hypothetical protein